MSEVNTVNPSPKKRGRKRQKKQVPRHETLMRPEITSPRQSVPKSFFCHHAKWRPGEHRNLLQALRQCASENDIKAVYKMIPTREPEEVEAEVNRLRNAGGQRGPELQAPIETWLDFCEELIHYEEEDHSKCLGRAMSIVANYEHFKKNKNGPDYKNLYKYFAAILGRAEAPKLSPLDSLVVLDLMHDLVDVLSETDTSKQRAIMKWKFSMLNCKVDINNINESTARTRRALSNIFPEGLLSNTKVKDTTPKPGKSKTKPPSSTVGPPDVNANNSSLNEVPDRSSSQTSSMTSGETITVEDKQDQNDPEQDEPPLKKTCVGGQGHGQGSSQGGRQGEGPLEKPQLYTLNPFCVPVEILKLPKRTKRKKRTGYKYL